MNDNSHGEIIIVRRSRDDHDDHHGGVWKIAFADFMTAMMAFFLVMWLINASNEETKKAVASYFNPIKLMDRTSNPKGVRNPKYGAAAKPDQKPDTNSTVISSQKGPATEKQDTVSTFEKQALFTDPYALLSEIAGGVDQRTDNSEVKSKSGQENSTGLGLSGGVAFQDPFDPNAWSLKYGAKQGEDKETGALETETTPEPPAGDANGKKSATSEKLEGVPTKLAQLPENKIDVPNPADTPTETTAPESMPEQADQEKPNENNSEFLEQVRKEIMNATKTTDVDAPNVEISSDGQGTLITLSEKAMSGMFNIGSARPTPTLVRIMAGIGKVLSRNSGRITISGHTDARKYSTGEYDNWRLSTARAHMAYYMLIRGGMKEEYVEKIEGYAAVKLITPDEPYSARNRRIEIRLRVP